MYFRIIESFNITECLFIALLTFLFYFFRFYYNYFTRPSPLPGPLPLPFELENFFFDGDFKRLTADLHQKYGDICEFRLGGFRRIVISKTDYFENLLSASKNLVLFANLKINQQWILVEILDEDCFLIIDTGVHLKHLIHFMIIGLISIVITGERGCSMASYYHTFTNHKFKLGNCHFDDPKSYNSDKFSRAFITYNKVLIFFNIVHPFLRRYVPYLRIKLCHSKKW
ncbi:hypothetical protein C2G38_2193857 [Gigaspora rosea]|uniref:Cytochrome P450 n=1 Tax=Gigaspora rosea TaxID=44941 RepID=A0A397UXI9_9GLOM|nr:hypothetical protein C2G38_2193857 [Gigaspora rosea]